MNEELKQIELMMHGCATGKKVMKFLKDEGYTLQSGTTDPSIRGSHSPNVAKIDREKKVISLCTEDMKDDNGKDYKVENAKERNALALIKAACLIKQEKYGADFFSRQHISKTEPISNADIVVTQCAFAGEMEEKSPKLAEIFDEHKLYYPDFKKTLKETGNEKAARSAAADSYFHHDALYDTPEAIFRKKYLTDFDGKPYYAEPASKTAVNTVFMAKAKQQGR